VLGPVCPLLIRPAFSASVAIGALFNSALYGTIDCLASSLQVGRDLSAQAAGLALLPLAATVALAGASSGRLALGAGVLNTSRQIGGALGVALTGGIVTASATATLRVPMLIVACAYVVAVLLARSIPPTTGR